LRKVYRLVYSTSAWAPTAAALRRRQTNGDQLIGVSRFLLGRRLFHSFARLTLATLLLHFVLPTGA
jgi:hypothetical protein